MSKENDDWFASVKECHSCESKNQEKRISGKYETLYCKDCGVVLASQPVV